MKCTGTVVFKFGSCIQTFMKLLEAKVLSLWRQHLVMTVFKWPQASNMLRLEYNCAWNILCDFSCSSRVQICNRPPPCIHTPPTMDGQRKHVGMSHHILFVDAAIMRFGSPCHLLKFSSRGERLYVFFFFFSKHRLTGSLHLCFDEA